MPEEPRKPSWPNPVRTPLLFIAGMSAAYVYFRWIGGTGGLDPAQLDEGWRRRATYDSIYLIFVHLMGLPALLLLAGGLIAGTIHTGLAGIRAGMCFALGSNRPRWIPGAALFLGVSARVMAWGGVAFGFGACGLLEFAALRFHEADEEAYFNLFRTANHWAITAPIAGIVLGRFVFGALAEGARIRSGDRLPPVFSRLQDLSLLVLFAIPWYLLCFLTREM